jgi:lipoate-protein ligase A
MQLIEGAAASTAEELALEEWLLESAENGSGPDEALRLWEGQRPAVVIGMASEWSREVNESACRSRGIPVFRRISGGAAVVTGPGCLVYSLVLSLEHRPHLRAVDACHDFVLGTLAGALGGRLDGVERQGTSDLTWHGRKFSGNSLRMKHGHLLYHGTILFADLFDLIEDCLHLPPRQPAYRACRSHREFLTPLALPKEEILSIVLSCWPARAGDVGISWDQVGRLAFEKYQSDAWTFRR